MYYLIHILFWLSLLLVIYVYLGYPLLVWLLARIRPRPVKRTPYKGCVSVVIAAHNEAIVIRNKITSLLETNGDVIGEILVGVDGAEDNTVSEVNKVRDSRVRLFDFDIRRGKPAVLNDLIPTCNNDIVVLMDARQILAPGALAVLLENFADPEVGAVSGELVFRPREACNASMTGGDSEGTIAKGMGLYWQYEKFIRKNESLSGSVPGATGALYAIRKCLYKTIPEKILIDDVVIPLQIVQQGYRCVFEGRAVVYDQPSSSAQQERIRKRRTLAGSIQVVQLYPEWLNPIKSRLWFRFLSHKGLRLGVPFFVFINIICCSLSCFYACLVLYGIAMAFYFLEKTAKRFRRSSIIGIPVYMGVEMNVAVIQAFVDTWRKDCHVKWN